MPCSAQPSMTYAYIHTYRRTRVTSSLKVWMVLQRYRTQARRHRKATPEGDEHLDVQRRRTEARRHRETTPVREIRQEQDRVRYHASREIDHSAPLFGQPAVHQKMRAFHSAMAATRFHRCGTCLENFPSVSLISHAEGSGQCRKCFTDKHIPKLYSPANNMDPGAVPPQLQVCHDLHEVL